MVGRAPLRPGIRQATRRVQWRGAPAGGGFGRSAGVETIMRPGVRDAGGRHHFSPNGRRSTSNVHAAAPGARRGRRSPRSRRDARRTRPASTRTPGASTARRSRRRRRRRRRGCPAARGCAPSTGRGCAAPPWTARRRRSSRSPATPTCCRSPRSRRRRRAIIPGTTRLPEQQQREDVGAERPLQSSGATSMNCRSGRSTALWTSTLGVPSPPRSAPATSPPAPHR